MAIVAIDRHLGDVLGDEGPGRPRTDNADVREIDLDGLRGRRVDQLARCAAGDLRRQVSYLLGGPDNSPLLEFTLATIALEWSDAGLTDLLVELFDAIMLTVQVSDRN